jgi:hypothetical protein
LAHEVGESVLEACEYYEIWEHSKVDAAIVFLVDSYSLGIFQLLSCSEVVFIQLDLFCAHFIEVISFGRPVSRVSETFSEHFKHIRKNSWRSAERAKFRVSYTFKSHRVQNVNLDEVADIEETEAAHAPEDKPVLKFFHLVERTVLSVTASDLFLVDRILIFEK